jgi:hypothetical protein
MVGNTEVRKLMDSLKALGVVVHSGRTSRDVLVGLEELLNIFGKQTS